MRNVDTIDSELRPLAAVRWSIREDGGEPSSRQADELLDERLERFQPVLYGEPQSHRPVTGSAGIAVRRPVPSPVGRDARRRAVVHAGVRRGGRRRPRRVVAGTSAHRHMPAANINAGVSYCGSCYGYR